jgi:hypothetical protein
LQTDFVPYSNGHEPEQPEQGEQTVRKHEQGEHHAEVSIMGLAPPKASPWRLDAKRTPKIAF